MKFLRSGHCCNASDIFAKFDIKKIKTHFSILKKHYKTREKKEMAVKVFLYALYLILLDIIENNVTFVFPTARQAYIQMEAISGEGFKKLRKAGGFKDVDFIESNFTGYRLQLSYKVSKGIRSKPIYVNAELKNKITEKTNEGMRYS